jgi:hypothetical protein
MQVLMADFFMADQLTSQVIIKLAQLYDVSFKCNPLKAKRVSIADSAIKAHGVCSVLLHGRKL